MLKNAKLQLLGRYASSNALSKYYLSVGMVIILVTLFFFTEAGIAFFYVLLRLTTGILQQFRKCLANKRHSSNIRHLSARYFNPHYFAKEMNK